MYRAVTLFLLAILVSGISPLRGQQVLSTKNKKAEKLFYEASDQYNAGNLKPALDLVSRALIEDPQFIEGWIMKGDIQAEANDGALAAESYKKAIAINPDYSPRLYYIVGNTTLNAGKYAEARDYFQKYLSYEQIPEKGKEVAAHAIRNCEFGIWAMDHPVPFKPENLGDSINSPYSEYVNTITADDRVLYFTRNMPGSRTSSGLQEDFFFSERLDKGWRKARNLGPPINTGGNEGGLFISPDGRFLFFAACDRPDGFGSCDLYWSKREGSRWGDPQNLGPVVNSGTWDSQPSFSSDGRTLYFSSRRPGGYGSSDIWKSVLQDDQTWSDPENLGDSINTPREEMAPFIHPDDQTLYFSSKGHTGLGGFDLYYSKKDVLGRWQNPVNLGYPINTWADEITLLVNSKGDVAYVSSDKFGGFGRQDIYSFDLYKEAQPVRVTYFKGVVYDKVTKKRLEASFELSDMESGRIVAQSSSDPVTGEFLLILPLNKDYGLNVSKEGYLFYSEHFSLAKKGEGMDPIIREVPLQPVQVGETVILKNIFFDTDKYDLKPESRVELQKLVSLLMKNPGIKIEISGHTDNVGTPAYNIELSNNRARAVYDYLVAQGIDKSRLTYAGYGLTRPIDTNETEEGRANNRRTEFRITAK